MGRIVDQSVKSTFKMTTGASVTTGDLLYATATDANVKPYSVQTPSFTTYTDTPITTFNTVAGAAASAAAVKVAYLTTGDYVVVYPSANTTPTFQRYNSSGVAQGSLTTIETTGTIQSLSIAPLANGNFVVAYNNTTTNVRAAVYGSTGTQLVAPFIVEAVSAASVVAAPMTSGGFVIIYNNTTTNIRYGNYNIAGVLQGSLTTLASGSYSSANTVDAKALSDGQVAVCYCNAVGNVRYAHIGTSGTISVIDTIAFTTTQAWPRICPTTGGSYILCVTNSTGNGFIQNRVVSSAGVMTPFMQSTAAGTATADGTTAITMPFTVNAGTKIQVAPNSVTGGGTMVFTNGTSSRYFRFDNRGAQITEFQGLQGTTATFYAQGIASNGNDTVISYYNASSIPSFVRFSATTNTNTTPAYITPTNNVIKDPVAIPPLSTMFTTTTSIGMYKVCTLNSGDIAILTQNASYTSGCHLTIMGQDGRIKLQKWVIGNCGSTFTQMGIAALSNGGFVVALSAASAAVGQFFIIYDSSANFVNSTQIQATAGGIIAVTGLTGGGFAVAYTDQTSSNSKYAVYSNTGATVLSPTALAVYPTGANSIAITSMVDGGFVIVMVTGTTLQWTRHTSTGVIISGPNSLTTTNNPVSVVGSSDNGFAILHFGTSTPNTRVYLSKYTSGNVADWTRALNPGSGITATPSVGIDVTYCPVNNYFISHYANGNTYVIHKINLQNNVINQTEATYNNGQTYFTTSVVPQNASIVSQSNDNVVILGACALSNNQNAYVTISQGYTIVGVAGESAAINTEIDVIVDGVTTLNKSYAPVTLSSFGANPSGVKGLITGFTAELTRQRNNLG
jgi:hypothetical protein